MIPINVDRNVSPKDFDRFSAVHGWDILVVTSVFRTFQGEGPFGGYPAVFVRLAGCNIGAKEDCPWCDTRFNIDEGTAYTFSRLTDVITPLLGPNRLIVVTGGEPLLQYDKLCAFITHVNNQRRLYNGDPLLWQIETNGLLLRPEMEKFFRQQNVHCVISPKIPHNRVGYRETPLWWQYMVGCASLKYVVSADRDSPYHLPALDASSTRLPVFVSGMAVYRRTLNTGEVASIWDDTLIDREATAANYMHAASVAMRLGYRVSYQTHLFGVKE